MFQILTVESTKRYSVYSQRAPVQETESIAVVCLHLSVSFLSSMSTQKDENEDEEEEEEGVESVWQEPMGVLAIADVNNSSLAGIRLAVLDQIPREAQPLRFHFLRPAAASGAGLESVPWQQETSTLLRDVLVVSSKGGRQLYITAPAAINRQHSCNRHRRASDAAASPPPPPTVMSIDERQVLLDHIRDLERKLALARFEQQQQQQQPVTSGNVACSMFKRVLLRAKAEGYLASSDVDELERQFLLCFSQRDLDELFGSPTNCPFPVFKMINDPPVLREYIECLERVLVQYGIRKQRLWDGKYWRHKVLRDASFMTRPSKFTTWAEAQPWRDDPAELTAYLAALLLLPGGEEDYRLLSDGQQQQTQPPLRQRVPVISIRRSRLASSSSVAQPPPHKQFTSISQAAQAITRHRQQQPDKESVPDDTVAAAACTEFRLDVLAPQYGVCHCGAHRTQHHRQQQQQQL